MAFFLLLLQTIKPAIIKAISPLLFVNFTSQIPRHIMQFKLHFSLSSVVKKITVLKEPPPKEGKGIQIC